MITAAIAVVMYSGTDANSWFSPFSKAGKYVSLLSYGFLAGSAAKYLPNMTQRVIDELSPLLNVRTFKPLCTYIGSCAQAFLTNTRTGRVISRRVNTGYKAAMPIVQKISNAPKNTTKAIRNASTAAMNYVDNKGRSAVRIVTDPVGTAKKAYKICGDVINSLTNFGSWECGVVGVENSSGPGSISSASTVTASAASVADSVHAASVAASEASTLIDSTFDATRLSFSNLIYSDTRNNNNNNNNAIAIANIEDESGKMSDLSDDEISGGKTKKSAYKRKRANKITKKHQRRKLSK
jgi:hypothetical protein